MNLRSCIIIYIYILASYSGHTQDRGGLGTVNVYGNPYFIQDSIDRLEQPVNGLKLFTNAWDVGTTNSHYGKFKFLPQDSNSYSDVDFRLGSKATQSIALGLVRPLGKKSMFGFNFQRISHPGWVTASFTRSSKVKIYSKHRIGKRVLINTNFDYLTLNRDQFGGYLDSNLNTVSLIDSGGRSLLGTDASNVLRKGGLGGDFNYQIIDQKTFYISAGSQVNGRVLSYNFSDFGIDSTYSYRFSNEKLSEQHDSFLLKSVSIRPYVEASLLRDSNRIKLVRVKSGLDEVWYWLRNNSRNAKPQSQNVFIETEISATKASINLDAKYYLSQINFGNYDVGMYGKYWLKREIDSIGKINETFIEGGVQRKETIPGYIFSNYQSELLIINSDLKNIQFSNYFFGLNAINGFLSYGVRLDYTQLINHTYFDRNANVHQFKGAIELYSVSANVGVVFSRFLFKTEAKYQMNNRSRIYSLPEWVNNSTINTNWPLFQDRLRLNLGIRSKFYSGYYARGYHPFLNSFYVQQSRKFSDYLQLDAMAFVTIKSVDVGLDILNASYGLFTTDIMVAPNYVSVPRYFQLHINWRFKN